MGDVDGLVAAARRGDPSALNDLIQQTSAEVWKFLAHLVDPQSADDLTQETYLRALGSLAAFRGASTVRTWLLAIARRVAADELRRRSRRPRGAILDLDDVDTPAYTAGGTDVAEEIAVRDLLHHLTPDRREPFVLTQIVGLSYAEAAELVGCPVGTIRSRVARARDDLMILLDLQTHPRRPDARDAQTG